MSRLREAVETRVVGKHEGGLRKKKIGPDLCESKFRIRNQKSAKPVKIETVMI